MTEEQVNGGPDEVVERSDVESAANDEVAAADDFADDLDAVVGAQEEGIVTHW